MGDLTREEERILVKMPSRIFVREDERGHVQFVHVPERWIACILFAAPAPLSEETRNGQ